MNYEKLYHELHLELVRKIIKDLEINGFSNGHHLYFSINMLYQGDGLEVPEFLRENYPEELPLVMEHEFRNVFAHDHYFEVDLCFDQIYYTFRVPYDSLMGVADPSAHFQLSLPGKPWEHLEREFEMMKAVARGAEMPKTEVPVSKPKPAGPAEVVQLDAFRKKS